MPDSEEAPLVVREDVQKPYTVAWFVACAAVLVASLGYYGFLQERVMAIPYGDGVYFTNSVFLVLCNRVVGVAVSMVAVNFEPKKSHTGAPLYLFGIVSLSNVMASCFQYEALKFVSFAVQMVGKSTKILPVMMWGFIVRRKRYPKFDWMVAAVVTAGCFCFLVGGELSSVKAGLNEHDHITWIVFFGLCVMVASIVCDGFTSMFQERLFDDYNTSVWVQMLYTNLWSSVITMLMLVSTGGYRESLQFLTQHPDFARDVIGLSLASVVGQVAIYTTIGWYGAVTFASVLNARQVLSTIVSSVYFNHPFTAAQFVGCFMVFGALGTKSYRYLREDAHKTG
jgi:adenosine 3'-phospho 5'-phosphosulfate transporter B2